jgi:hypothetical protein
MLLAENAKSAGPFDIRSRSPWQNVLLAILSFLFCYSAQFMLKASPDSYIISNSIFSIVIFVITFLIYGIAFKDLSKRLAVISALLGFLFACFMSFGANIIVSGATLVGNWKVWVKILCAAPFFMALVIILYRCLENYSSKPVASRAESPARPKSWEPGFVASKRLGRAFLFAWILTFIAWVPGLIASYPGIYAYDSVYQMQYYTSGEILLHHPLIHTYLLGFCVWTLGNLLGDLKLGMLVYSIIQMLVLSAGMAAIYAFMVKKDCPAWFRRIALLMMMFFPVNAIMSFSATKDVIYAAFTCLMLLCFYEIAENPDLLRKKGFVALTIAFSFLQAAFKVQGIIVLAFTGIIALIVLRKNRGWMLGLLAAVFAIFLVYSGPVTTLLHGVKADEIHEMMSVPAMQLAKARIDNADELTEEEKAEIEEYIPNWSDYYVTPGISDLVKNSFNSDAFKKDPLRFFRLWASVGMKAPETFFNAFTRLNIGLWYPDMNYRDPQAWHPYWEYNSSHQDPSSSFTFILVDRDTPACMEWLASFYQSLTYDNIYQKIPLVSLLFSSGAYCWVVLLYIGYSIYRKKYQYLIPASIPLAIWFVLLLGPVVLFRYIFPIALCDYVLLASSLMMGRRPFDDNADSQNVQSMDPSGNDNGRPPVQTVGGCPLPDATMSADRVASNTDGANFSGC